MEFVVYNISVRQMLFYRSLIASPAIYAYTLNTGFLSCSEATQELIQSRFPLAFAKEQSFPGISIDRTYALMAPANFGSRWSLLFAKLSMNLPTVSLNSPRWC